MVICIVIQPETMRTTVLTEMRREYAEGNASDRLQIVRGANSSYLGFGEHRRERACDNGSRPKARSSNPVAVSRHQSSSSESYYSEEQDWHTRWPSLSEGQPMFSGQFVF
jgi:hypothetical protein